jgi:predicted phosphohydrolase
MTLKREDVELVEKFLEKCGKDADSLSDEQLGSAFLWVKLAELSERDPSLVPIDLLEKIKILPSFEMVKKMRRAILETNKPKTLKESKKELTLCVISDTHGKHESLTLPLADILIFCGDFSFFGDIHHAESFIKWLANQPHEYKIFICGNHDIFAERTKYLFKPLVEEVKDSGVIYLEDSGVTIEGVKFYGTPWTTFYGAPSSIVSSADAFQATTIIEQERKPGELLPPITISYDKENLKKYWDKIPQDTDVLITHSPPYAILDKNECGERFGCEHLRKRISEIPSIKYHLFGHIHAGTEKLEKNGVTYVNAAVCDENYKDENYKPVYSPILLTINIDKDDA